MKSFAGVFDLLTPNRLHTNLPKIINEYIFLATLSPKMTGSVKFK